MFLTILKRDLKRKKTMNCILLLFVVFSAMFMASSVNNIISVGGGIDSYLDRAGLSDENVAVSGVDNAKAICEKVQNEQSDASVRLEPALMTNYKNFSKDGKKLGEWSSMSLINDISSAQLTYFDEDNKEVKDIEKGKIRIAASLAYRCEIEKGDIITIEIDGRSKELEYAGIIKDAFFGAEMLSNYRFFVNHEDYSYFADDEQIQKDAGGALVYIDTPDTKKTEKLLSQMPGIMLIADRDLMHTTYLMEIFAAAIMLFASICLIAIAFVVLRFTINFTITEEFREIGVMKAVGLKNRSVRGLYLVKYLGISLVGTLVGFVLSFPLGRMLMDSVNKKIVLENDSSVLVSLLCCAAVVMIIMLFSYRCTRKIKKLSPIDAVRNGQTGERFKKRGLISLSKSRLSGNGFLALNDVLSSPKQYSMMTLIFTLCALLVMILSTTANTLNSDSMLTTLSLTKSDLYLSDTARSTKILTGSLTVDEATAQVSDILAKNGMPADVSIEIWYKFPVTVNGEKQPVSFLQNSDTHAEDYDYTEGSAPQNDKEIALTKKLADELDVTMGDEIEITIDNRQEKFLITGYFQTMANLGEIARFHESTVLPDNAISNNYAFQIDFKDDPDEKTIEERKETISEIFDCNNVLNGAEYVDDCTGASSAIKSIKDMLLVMMVVIIVMISVLMERSFISKEKNEIALLKALGFKSRSIIAVHTYRSAIVAAAAVIIACALSVPATRLTMDPIFGIMGLEGNIPYRISYFEEFALIPLITAAATVLGCGFTAVYSKKIKASDTSGNE
ncbi:MAG: FtsX-like permease family protein [Ruminococcus sp.]|nr:FtsX-like permease family protein [Ruminococcus sp.]